MSGLWIRVNAALADDADVSTFGAALFHTREEWDATATASGLLCNLWSACVLHQEDGNIGGRTDEKIEEWARWRGERGVFAKAFRKLFTRNGVIREWDDYQGTLIARRQHDRARKSAGKSRGMPQEVPAEGQRNSSRNVDVDGNGTTTAESSNADPRKGKVRDVDNSGPVRIGDVVAGMAP